MSPDFDKLAGLLPVIVQDSQTMKVLMLGFMNHEAFAKTQAEGKVTFFSRTKNRLWTKGETSGNYLHVERMLLDCDADTLLIYAQPQGVVCHTGTDTCFAESNTASTFSLTDLERIIAQRKQQTDPKASYTSYLFQKGIAKIAQKVGEEAVESVIEAVAGNRELFKSECADLLYHLLVLLAAQDMQLSDIEAVLAQRHANNSTNTQTTT
jgi:phosphoribosyl-AMP cyclohydrolase / phosphoribosyl-ATP pyrophosphohydrolase